MHAVRAICGIAESTKTKQEGFTGEKGEMDWWCESGRTASRSAPATTGIGFKSVFLIAEEVFIASNGFIWKFDARIELGAQRNFTRSAS